MDVVGSKAYVLRGQLCIVSVQNRDGAVAFEPHDRRSEVLRVEQSSQSVGGGSLVASEVLRGPCVCPQEVGEISFLIVWGGCNDDCCVSGTIEVRPPRSHSEGRCHASCFNDSGGDGSSQDIQSLLW